MSALARKTAPDYHDHRVTSSTARPATKAAPRPRWHEEKPSAAGKKPSPKSSTRSTPRAAASAEAVDVDDLLSHFGHGVAERQAQTRTELEARREARRRARLRHRPFRMSAVGTVIVSAPLVLLASLLWLKSSALTLSRHDSKLQDQISAARFELERTRKEIATVNASPHIERWASERGWRRATQKDFDRVSSLDARPAQSDAMDTE
jgi:hypothetical protein